MKKVIKNIEEKVSQKGAKYYLIEFFSGEKGISYENLGNSGDEIEIEIETKNNFTLFKPPSSKKYFPQKDYTFEKRKESYNIAMRLYELNKEKVTTKDLDLLASHFYKKLNEQ